MPDVYVCGQSELFLASYASKVFENKKSHSVIGFKIGGMKCQLTKENIWPTFVRANKLIKFANMSINKQ